MPNNITKIERLIKSKTESFKLYKWQIDLLRTIDDVVERMAVFEALCEYMFLGSAPGKLRTQQQRVIFFRLLTAYK